MRARIALTGLLILSIAVPMGAAVLLNDPFDYTNGSLVTVSGGTWTHHSGVVTGEVQVVSGRILLSSSDSEDVGALLSGQPYDSAGATNRFYASFNVRFTALPTAGGTYFAVFKDASATGFRGRVWALTGGAGAGKFRLGMSSTTSTINVTNPTELFLNTNYLVVTRLVNSNSTAKLWINPVAESDPSVATDDGNAGFTVTAYAFRQASGEGSLSIDNLRVGTSFVDVVTNALPLSGPEILSAPLHQAVVQGATAVFSVTATGTPLPSFQWQFNGTNLPGATTSMLLVSNVGFAQAGFYTVTLSNAIDSMTTDPAALTLLAGSPPAFSLLTYNLHGNGALNWSTNTAHVKAIGRQVQYLDPDILTFQEVPVTNNGTAQMTNFVAAFRPGFFLVTNSSDDGFIRSVILSRYPVLSSTSRLHGTDLTPFGYSASTFTRDLFEARISVPGFPQPLHVFTVHLKSGQDTDTAAKRAAEAGAVSNFFVSVYLGTNQLEPYLLTGDLNEDLLRPTPGVLQSLPRLIGGPAGLLLTTPFNSTNHSELTFSIQSAALTRRYDYILPCGLLFSNVSDIEIFRTDLLNPLPPGLNSNDDVTASDHLPVLMKFANPYSRPFRLLNCSVTNLNVQFAWESVPGQPYTIETSSNLLAWNTIASNLVATDFVSSFATNATGDHRFFRVRRLP